MVLRSSLMKVPRSPVKDDFLCHSDVKCEDIVYFLSVLCFIIVQNQPHRCWDICKFNYGVCGVCGSAIHCPQSFLTMLSSGRNLAVPLCRGPDEESIDRLIERKSLIHIHHMQWRPNPSSLATILLGTMVLNADEQLMKSILTYAPHWSRCVSARWMCCISDHPPSLRFHLAPQIS